MARKRKFRFKKVSIARDGVKIKLDMDRFSLQFQRAQYVLDGQVMTDMIPLMPHLNGTFIQVTRGASAAIQGSGQVYASYAPQGRFLYEGKVMVDELTGSAWARKGARKVVTDIPLRYTKTHNPEVTDHWFDAAKARNGDRWVAKVKQTAGGGMGG